MPELVRSFKILAFLWHFLSFYSCHSENFMKCSHGRRKYLLQGGATRGFFQIFFQGWPKVVKFVFSLSKLRKQPILTNISKSRGVKAHPASPSDAHECSVCVCALILFLAYLLRKRVCIHSRNVNNKYCIVIVPVEKHLQPVNYAWWQKQHTMFRLR